MRIPITSGGCSKVQKEYPELFDNSSKDDALRQFSTVLTPGFRGGNAEFDKDRFVGIIKRSLSNPRTGVTMGKKGWEVLKNEGIKGIKRRFLN